VADRRDAGAGRRSTDARRQLRPATAGLRLPWLAGLLAARALAAHSLAAIGRVAGVADLTASAAAAAVANATAINRASP
jgi:hypothetical protein